MLLWWARRREGVADSQDGVSSRSGPWSRQVLRALSDNAYLALAIAGILTYVPLLVVDRYIAVYIAIIAITAFLLACAGLARPSLSRTTVDRVALATALVALVAFVFAARQPAEHVARQLAGDDAPGTSDLRIARALTRAGIVAGDGVAFVGDTDGVLNAYWARLDGARVVGNVDDPAGGFWRLAPGAQSSRLALLQSRAGARAVVTDEPQARLHAGWVPIPGTADSYRPLPDG